MSPPSAFGTYRVLHQIGSGVLGPVFRAYDSQRDRLAAIKTFKLDLVPESAARLADRLRAMAASRPAHPAILGASDAGLAGSTPYVALEFAAGESLDVMLRQSGTWPVARAMPVLREIAAAIDASWAGGVGHGALHPRDIFISLAPLEVRVGGFGVGQALDVVGAKVAARRPYSAPERADGGPWDHRADVFAGRGGVRRCCRPGGRAGRRGRDDGGGIRLRAGGRSPRAGGRDGGCARRSHDKAAAAC
jgi:serine/threonine-protein kinase